MDRTNHHLFQPLLYQVATGVLSEGEIAPPIRDVLRKQRNTQVLMGDVTDIAHAIAYLASDESAFVTGTELVLDGGMLA